MKKCLSFIAVAFLPLFANAYDACIDGIYYNLSGDEAEVTYCDDFNYSGDVVIPERVTYNGKTYSVTGIGGAAFYDCENLTSVVIPKSLTRLSGEYTFAYCTSLRHIDLTSKAGAVYYRTFCGCTALESVVLPQGATYLGGKLFEDCTSLKSITIPGQVSEIGYYAFDGCTNLREVVFEDGEGRVALEEPSSIFNECPIDSLYLGRRLLYKYSHWQGGGYYEGYIVQAFPSCLKKLCLGINASLENTSFGNVTSLTHIYPMWDEPTSFSGYMFSDAAYDNATLFVPEGSLQNYQSTESWNHFRTIVALVGGTHIVEKCATPTICYAGGKLKFTSATEGAECVTIISDSDIKTHYGNEIPLSATYNITVYATRATYENSDTIHATLCWIDAEPRTEGLDEDAVTEVKALPVLIQTQGGIVTIQGAAEGTLIAVYDLDGRQYGTTVSDKERATIPTSLRPGSTAVVKIGERVVKVLVK